MKYIDLDTRRQFVQSKEWYDWIVYSDTVDVEPGESEVMDMGIAASHDFACLYLKGTFTTNTVAGDDGVCQMAAKITDNGSQTILWPDPVNLALELSPGRQRTTGIAGDPSSQLFYPQPFEHMFRATADIHVEVFNASDIVNTCFMAFIGNKYYIQKKKQNYKNFVQGQ